MSSTWPRFRRQWSAGVLAAGLTIVAVTVSGAHGAPTTSAARSREAAQLDRANLQLAAHAIEAQALDSGVLRRPMAGQAPATVILRSLDALLERARSADASGAPRDTRQIMGAVPFTLSHRIAHRPGHRGVAATHTLRRFTHSVPIAGSAGFGMHRSYSGVVPARFQHPDGVYVDPQLPALRHPTVAAVAIRAALSRLGQPYVWAAAGPVTFDCSGLVRWAYARAGLVLTHYTGDQWNEGRLIPPSDVLPGDLILFGRTLHHVGIYLAAGWMLNAPFTGHYVDVVPVGSQVAGIVRP